MKNRKISFQKLKKVISSERGEGETLTVIAIVLAAVLMLGIPMLTMSNRTEDITQQIIQTEVNNFVNLVAKIGELTMDDYSAFVESISSTGNAYDIEIVIRVKDENPSKKTSQTTGDKEGENETYDEYTSQILDDLEKYGVKYLKKGDYIYVTVQDKAAENKGKLEEMLLGVTGHLRTKGASARCKSNNRWKIR